MKVIYLIRGLPGSGKSTLAEKITQHHFEADHFFIGDDGVYRHDKERLGQAHADCQVRTEMAMRAEVATIAVANTFVKRWELETYLIMAKLFGYAVIEVTVKGNFHSIHNVPPEVIERMRKGWEL